MSFVMSVHWTVCVWHHCSCTEVVVLLVRRFSSGRYYSLSVVDWTHKINDVKSSLSFRNTYSRFCRLQWTAFHYPRHLYFKELRFLSLCLSLSHCLFLCRITITQNFWIDFDETWHARSYWEVINHRPLQGKGSAENGVTRVTLQPNSTQQPVNTKWYHYGVKPKRTCRQFFTLQSPRTLHRFKLRVTYFAVWPNMPRRSILWVDHSSLNSNFCNTHACRWHVFC